MKEFLLLCYFLCLVDALIRRDEGDLAPRRMYFVQKVYPLRGNIQATDAGNGNKGKLILPLDAALYVENTTINTGILISVVWNGAWEHIVEPVPAGLVPSLFASSDASPITYGNTSSNVLQRGYYAGKSNLLNIQIYDRDGTPIPKPKPPDDFIDDVKSVCNLLYNKITDGLAKSTSSISSTSSVNPAEAASDQLFSTATFKHSNHSTEPATGFASATGIIQSTAGTKSWTNFTGSWSPSSVHFSSVISSTSLPASASLMVTYTSPSSASLSSSTSASGSESLPPSAVSPSARNTIVASSSTTSSMTEPLGTTSSDTVSSSAAFSSTSITSPKAVNVAVSDESPQSAGSAGVISVVLSGSDPVDFSRSTTAGPSESTWSVQLQDAHQKAALGTPGVRPAALTSSTTSIIRGSQAEELQRLSSDSLTTTHVTVASVIASLTTQAGDAKLDFGTDGAGGVSGAQLPSFVPRPAPSLADSRVTAENTVIGTLGSDSPTIQSNTISRPAPSATVSEAAEGSEIGSSFLADRQRLDIAAKLKDTADLRPGLVTPQNTHASKTSTMAAVEDSITASDILNASERISHANHLEHNLSPSNIEPDMMTMDIKIASAPHASAISGTSFPATHTTPDPRRPDVPKNVHGAIPQKNSDARPPVVFGPRLRLAQHPIVLPEEHAQSHLLLPEEHAQRPLVIPEEQAPRLVHRDNTNDEENLTTDPADEVFHGALVLAAKKIDNRAGVAVRLMTFAAVLRDPNILNDIETIHSMDDLPGVPVVDAIKQQHIQDQAFARGREYPTTSHVVIYAPTPSPFPTREDPSYFLGNWKEDVEQHIREGLAMSAEEHVKSWFENQIQDMFSLCQLPPGPSKRRQLKALRRLYRVYESWKAIQKLRQSEFWNQQIRKKGVQMSGEADAHADRNLKLQGTSFAGGVNRLAARADLQSIAQVMSSDEAPHRGQKPDSLIGLTDSGGGTRLAPAEGPPGLRPRILQDVNTAGHQAEMSPNYGKSPVYAEGSTESFFNGVKSIAMSRISNVFQISMSSDADGPPRPPKFEQPSVKTGALALFDISMLIVDCVQHGQWFVGGANTAQSAALVVQLAATTVNGAEAAGLAAARIIQTTVQFTRYAGPAGLALSMAGMIIGLVLEAIYGAPDPPPTDDPRQILQWSWFGGNMTRTGLENCQQGTTVSNPSPDCQIAYGPGVLNLTLGISMYDAIALSLAINEGAPVTIEDLSKNLCVDSESWGDKNNDPCPDAVFKVVCSGNEPPPSSNRASEMGGPDTSKCRTPTYEVIRTNIDITVGDTTTKADVFKDRVDNGECKFVTYPGQQTYSAEFNNAGMDLKYSGKPCAFACNLDAGDDAEGWYISDGDGTTTDGQNGYDMRFPVREFQPLPPDGLVCLHGPVVNCLPEGQYWKQNEIGIDLEHYTHATFHCSECYIEIYYQLKVPDLGDIGDTFAEAFANQDPILNRYYPGIDMKNFGIDMAAVQNMWDTSFTIYKTTPPAPIVCLFTEHDMHGGVVCYGSGANELEDRWVNKARSARWYGGGCLVLYADHFNSSLATAPTYGPGELATLGDIGYNDVGMDENVAGLSLALLEDIIGGAGQA